MDWIITSNNSSLQMGLSCPHRRCWRLLPSSLQDFPLDTQLAYCKCWEDAHPLPLLPFILFLFSHSLLFLSLYFPFFPKVSSFLLSFPFSLAWRVPGAFCVDLHLQYRSHSPSGYWALDACLIRIEMSCKGELHTRFQRFRIKKVSNNFYNDYALD